MNVGWIWIISVLLIGSVYDCKYYKLPLWLLVLGVLGGLFCWVYQGEGVSESLISLLPGLAALGLSYITREQIGYGDGILLLMIGICVGLQHSIWIIFTALLGSFVASLFLIIFRKARGRERIPLVPYLWMGAMIVMIGSLI